MTMTVTMLQTRMGESGSLLSSGSSYTVSKSFGAYLVSSGYATDPNRTLSPQDAKLGPITFYTAAQLAALAAAGGLTPYATYVASDTGAEMFATSLGALSARRGIPSGQPSVLFLGDSISIQGAARMGQAIASYTAGAFTASYSMLWADRECNAAGTATRDGTLTYDSTTRTLTWRAPLANTNNGDSIGAPVDASRDGVLYVPSGTPGNGVRLHWQGASRVYTSGAATVSINQDGFQLWAYGSNGFPEMTFAAALGRFARAPVPASCPPGTDGIYGIGGASASTLLNAEWQWGGIACDICVIQIGTNDFVGSTTVSQYLSDVQSIIARRLNYGTQLVVWTTVLPRTADASDAAVRAKKAAVARGMQIYADASRGAVVVFDAASAVTDPATGGWLSGYSDDGVHPNTVGAVAIARALAPFLAAASGQAVPRPTYLTDSPYDATNNPSGNLLTTLGLGQMAGTGGTYGTRGASVPAWAATTAYVIGQPVLANGNLYVCTTPGTTGSTAPNHQVGTAIDGTVTWRFIAIGASAGIATGWRAENSSGANGNVACAKIARTDGVAGDWQAVIAWTTVADAETCRLYTTTTFSAGLTPEAVYAGSAEIVLAASKTLMRCDFKGLLTGTPTVRYPLALQGQGSQAWPDTSVPLPMLARIPSAWKFPTGDTGIGAQIELAFTSAGVGWAVILVGRVGFNLA